MNCSNRGTYISNLINERIKRLNTPSPTLRKKSIITEHNAMSIIAPLSHTIVTEQDFDYTMKVLEVVSNRSVSLSESVSRYIALNIINGIDPKADIDINKYKISETCTEILEEGFRTVATCQRVINNQDMLNRRFNIDKIVKSNKYNPPAIIEELCEMIDTYNVPNHVKFNIALENITYSLNKNNIDVNDDTILEEVTEYFLMRDEVIPDTMYQEYQNVLQNNEVLNAHRSIAPMVHAVLSSDAKEFKTRLENVFSRSKDDFVLEHFKPMAFSIKTEADALKYIEEVSGYIDTNHCRYDDKQRLCYSVKQIPKYAPISQDFVDIKSAENFDKDKFDKLATSDVVLSEEEPLNEEIDNEVEHYMNLFKEDADYNEEQLKKMIDTFKSEQDKSRSKIKNFFVKLHTKSPESIIDQTPSLMGIARAGILLGTAALGPVGLITSAVAGLVSWLVGRKINDKEGERLLKHIQNEMETVKKKIEKTSDEKKKKDLEEYLSCLKSCEKKVADFLNDLSDEYHSTTSDDDDDDLGFGDDDLGFDDDIDFDESATLESVERLLNEAVSEIDAVNESIDLDKIISCAASQNILSEMSPIIKSSDISREQYSTALDMVYNNTKDIKIRSAITIEQGSLNESITYVGIDRYTARSLSNNVIHEINQQIINEGFNLNSIRLLMQNAKRKLKGLNTKQKSLWQSVDAAGSGLVRSVEKAMTSDRREAIIKGSIVPSFSKCIKSAIALAGAGVLFGPMPAMIGAVGALGVSKALNAKEKKLIFDEIDTELKVVEKQIEIAQNDGDMNQYRFLLNYQKKLTREYQRIKYGLKVSGRDIPSATIPGRH